MTSIIRLSRRDVLAAAGATAALALTGCGGGGGSDPPAAGPQTVFKLSGRGRRVSRAAKSHNANKLFATAQAADANRAHPGDRSKIVTIVVSQQRWDALFGSGARVVDLRRV